jgi:hypothetical protein
VAYANSLYHVGTRVRELAAPHRSGVVAVVSGRGSYARLWVRLDGRGYVMFSPSGLEIA